MHKKSLYLIYIGLALVFGRGIILYPLQSLLGISVKTFTFLFTVSGFLAFSFIVVGVIMHLYSRHKYGHREPKTKGLLVSRIGLWIAFGPLLVALIAFLIGFVLGCESSGGSPGTCAVGGKSMANLLWTMLMVHWLTLMTMVPGLIMWLIGTVWHHSILKRTNA